MQPDPVAGDFDVAGDGEPRAGPAGEGLPVIHLVLQGGEEAFGGGVVPAHAGPAGAGADAVCLAEPGELAGGKLLGFRESSQHLFGGGVVYDDARAAAAGPVVSGADSFSGPADAGLARGSGAVLGGHRAGQVICSGVCAVAAYWPGVLLGG